MVCFPSPTTTRDLGPPPGLLIAWHINGGTLRVNGCCPPPPGTVAVPVSDLPRVRYWLLRSATARPPAAVAELAAALGAGVARRA